MTSMLFPGVYIMTNSTHSTVYIGASSLLLARLQSHRSGSGSAFTPKYRCTKLVYYEFYETVEAAYTRERELKKWSRFKKDAVITTFNPAWQDVLPDLAKQTEALV